MKRIHHDLRSIQGIISSAEVMLSSIRDRSEHLQDDLLILNTKSLTRHFEIIIDQIEAVAKKVKLIQASQDQLCSRMESLNSLVHRENKEISHLFATLGAEEPIQSAPLLRRLRSVVGNSSSADIS